MRELRTARAFVALICVIGLLFFAATSPSAAHVDLALPVLLFCFFVVITLSLLRVSDGNPTLQRISLLSVLISRGPPSV